MYCSPFLLKRLWGENLNLTWLEREKERKEKANGGEDEADAAADQESSDERFVKNIFAMCKEACTDPSFDMEGWAVCELRIGIDIEISRYYRILAISSQSSPNMISLLSASIIGPISSQYYRV